VVHNSSPSSNATESIATNPSYTYTHGGRATGPPAAGDGEGGASEASGWENGEREERLAVGGGGREACGGKSRRTAVSFCYSLIFLCLSFGTYFLADSAGGLNLMALGQPILFFVSSFIACDLHRSWQYTHILRFPRHYGSS